MQSNTCTYIYRKVLTNREWCGSMVYYVNCHQTSAVQHFLRYTLLHYVSERLSYSYDSYTIRNMLAVIDYNNHLHELPVLEPVNNGVPDVHSHFSRNAKMWAACDKKKTNKEYSYIPGL